MVKNEKEIRIMLVLIQQLKLTYGSDKTLLEIQRDVENEYYEVSFN